MSTMYANPSACAWTGQYAIDPAILTFHKTLPEYSQTPLRPLPQWLCEKLGVRHILLKDESRRFGLPAYKILGASWGCYRVVIKELSLPETTSLERARRAAEHADLKFYTATDGNYGRAVARMATLLGAQAYIYVPKVMAEATKEKIASEGAKVIVVNGDYDTAVKEAERISVETGGLLIEDTAWPGYEEIPQWIVDGYSTMMVEIDEQAQEVVKQPPTLVLVPVGAGSLAQAVVAHYKAHVPPSTVFSVEPDTAACLKTSLERGQITSIPTEDTSMCGMNCGTVSSLAWPYLRDGVDGSITITDVEAKTAQDLLVEIGIHIGPCGAASLAALTKVLEEEKDLFHIDCDSVVVLLATEGPR